MAAAHAVSGISGCSEDEGYHLRVANPGDARTLRGALVRGGLRLILLAGPAVLAMSWAAPDEPIGNRRFLWGLAGLLFVVAAWGLTETVREVKRVAQRH